MSSFATSVQENIFLDAIAGVVTHYQGLSSSGALLGTAQPITLVQRGLALVNPTPLVLPFGTVSVAFLSSGTRLYDVPLNGPPAAEAVALTFRGA